MQTRRRSPAPAGLAIAAVLLTACSVSSGVDAVEESHSHEDGQSHTHPVAEDGHTHDDTHTDYGQYCLSERLYLSEVWVEAPMFSELKTVVEEYPDGSSAEISVTDIEASSEIQRAESASRAPIVGASTDDRLPAIAAASPSGDGPDSAFMISNVGGYFLGGLVDAADGKVFAWTGCEDGWTDYTAELAQWAKSDDPDAMVAALKSIAAVSRTTAEGDAHRAAETERLTAIALGLPEPIAWIDRPAHSRSLVDPDTPVEITEKLGSAYIRIEDVREVGDPDLVVCPVQASATSGYCFGVDALANAYEGSVIKIAVLPDEPLEFILGRESRWDDPGHEVTLGNVDGRTEAVNLRIEGDASTIKDDLSGASAALQVALEPVDVQELKLDEGVQFLGGTVPFEDN